MKLELGKITIKDIQFAEKSEIKDGVLYVSKDDLREVALSEEKIKAADFEVAKPGESVRITPVKDVVEPRIKVEGRGGVFPGFVSGVDTVGSGKTLALKGMAVVTTGPIVNFQEGVIDMSGPGADYTPFSKTLNLCVICEPYENVEKHQYESALRMVGLKLAAHIAELEKDLQPEESTVYETPDLLEGMKAYPELPRVAYVQMLQSQGLLHDTYVYGVDAKKILPTILYPTESMDGAILSGNCVSACDKNPTYVHENNPIVEDLFAQHGKTINFVAHVITNENVFLADKERSSNQTAKLCKMLGLDGVIVSEEGFGNPDTDLIMNCKKIEAADALVSGGNANELVRLPKLDKVIGTMEYISKIAGSSDKALQEDGSIEVELQVITGATSEVGFNKLSAR